MKKGICLLLCISVLLSVAACKSKERIQKPMDPNPSPIPEVDLIEQQVEQMLESMTIEEKIAQMLIIYHKGDVVDDVLVSEIENVKPGGFILFANNISTYEKTKTFVDTLQNHSEIPMVITIDQEGGSVQRMKALTDPEATVIPEMYTLGTTNDEKLAYDVGRVMAEEMRTIGVNVVFGPVVDIASDVKQSFMGKRCFGSTPDVVSKMALGLAKGMEDNHIIATYKHFPGHGDTKTDSHTSLPIIRKGLKELQGEELIPFQNAIDGGAKMIMIGHIALPELTGDYTPASLSKEIVTDLLKTEMGYNGLVVTDALNMGALTNAYSNEEIYVKAIEAGVDLLLMPHDAAEAIKCIKEHVPESRIDESVRKILRFKCTYLSEDYSLDVSYLNSQNHQEVIDRIH